MRLNIYGVTLIMVGGLCVLLGVHLGRGCNAPQGTKHTRDTVTAVITRPVTVRDTVRVKSVMVKHKDTTYFIERPVNIPCGDTSFIAQADSVITSTMDTVNMAFAYNKGKANFSLVFKPRPDSVQTITVPVPVENNNAWTWGPAIFAVGVLLGIWGARQ
jgi:hypothetical protein